MSTVIIQGMKSAQLVSQGYVAMRTVAHYCLSRLSRRYKLAVAADRYILTAVARRYKLEVHDVS